ncbi:MAG: hypothetical protein ABI383_00690, partial [Acidobacteriaceae bacterium]
MAICIFALFHLNPLSGAAQKTVTQDAGGGMKEELLYDAAGQIVETRTIAADGKLLTKNLFEFKPGFSTAQQKMVSYWPDGASIKSVSHENYDQTANFLGEEIEVFDQAGKHTGGHKLVHNPLNGVYKCWHWESSTQRYKTIACPAGEDSGAPPQPLPPLTYDQASKMVSEARQKAAVDAKVARIERKSPIHPSSNPSPTEIAVILPARLHHGEHVSGSVVSGPAQYAQYEGMPDLMVVRIATPSNGTDAPFSLADWKIELPGANPQDALGSFSFQVPAGGSGFNITLRDSSHAVNAVVRAIKINAASATPKTSGAFQATPLCIKSSVCVIGGRFDGDSSHIFASFEGEPAPILAASATTAHIGVPDTIRSGMQHLLLVQAPKLIAFPVCIAELTIGS